MGFVRGNTKSLSVRMLILANIVPLLGVVFFGWSLFAIMFFYWFENVAVGLFNVVKIKQAEGKGGRMTMTMNGKAIDPSDAKTRKEMSFFFALHYGIFTIVHGVFIFALFGPPDIPVYMLVISGISLFISHGISYCSNFLGRKEYKTASAVALFWQPYKRVLVMHITILAGGSLIEAIGAPIAALIVMIGLKTLIDLISHVAEHKKFQLAG